MTRSQWSAGVLARSLAHRTADEDVRAPALVVALLLLLASCSFFSRTKNTYYSLESVPGTVVNAAGAPLALGGIELPPGIDRREVVMRKADHSLDVRSAELWSAPLNDLVMHTLASDLAKRLPEAMFVLPGQVKPAGARTLYIVFEDLAANANGEFVLEARWAARHERITVPLTSTKSADIVAAMNNALAMLADRVVSGI